MKQDIKHVAIIMDGNARWAVAQNLPIKDGHKAGAEAIRALLPIFIEHHIPYLTLYAFSSENWQRPEEEINFLLQLLNDYIISEINELKDQKIKLKIIGNFAKLDDKLKTLIDEVNQSSVDEPKLTLCIAFDYGARAEIVDACKAIIKNSLKDIDEKTFENCLYDGFMPSVDILIRTADTYRISNFLLWQIAYAELFFLKKFWPDFRREDLIDVLKRFKIRQRNFGAR